MEVTGPQATPSPEYSIDDILKNTKPKGGGFKKVLGTIASGAANIFFPGLGGIIGGGLSNKVLGAAMPTLGGETTQFLQLQRQMLQEQRTFELMSTVLKCRHDSSMAAVRNMK
ncbi:MAG TPA: hypothetical protein VN428_02170 [Bryobacteraceae bacterium]|nr:hypothetical protein [Bryobacteraceae bacterium]